MGIRNILFMRFQNRITFLLLCSISLLAFSGCNKKSVKAEEQTPAGAPIIESPTVDSENIDDQEVEEKRWAEDLRLCLVLGPGMARGLAHVGVIDIIEKAKLPIHCIVGVEMGALVGVLYSMNRNLNKVQWQIFKLKSKVYLDYPLFSAIRSSKVQTKKINSVLKEYLGFTRLGDYDLKVAVGVTAQSTGTPEVMEDAGSVEAVVASIALPEVFDAQTISGRGKYFSGNSSNPYPVREAYDLGATHVLVVDLLSDSFSMNGLSKRDSEIWKQFAVAKNIGRYQLQSANYILRPNLRNFKFTNFDRRVEIIEQGKSSMREMMERLREDLSEKE